MPSDADLLFAHPARQAEALALAMGAETRAPSGNRASPGADGGRPPARPAERDTAVAGARPNAMQAEARPWQLAPALREAPPLPRPALAFRAHERRALPASSSPGAAARHVADAPEAGRAARSFPGPAGSPDPSPAAPPLQAVRAESDGPTDITAAIEADQQSIVFTGGAYVIDIPAGQTVIYSGVMSGTGTLEVEGGGTLILTNDSTFSLPAAQQAESVTTVAAIETIYDGIDLGRDTAGVNLLLGQNAPAVTIDAGTTLDFGDPSQNLGLGVIGSFIDVYGAAFNADNVSVHGTLGVYYWGGYGYGISIGEISGDGLAQTGIGTNFFDGVSDFTGNLISYSVNFGGAFANFDLPSAHVIDNAFILSFSVQAPTAQTPDPTLVPETIYEQNYGNSIHNQGAGELIFTGVYHYSDAPTYADPSLSNPLLDYMLIGGDASQRTFYAGYVEQFGDGTNATYFMPGNQYTSAIGFSGGTLGLDYNGIVAVDSTLGNSYGPTTTPEDGNLVIVGTQGNHIVYTQQAEINGFTVIDANATLQLGDGTLGDAHVITTQSAYGPITGTYTSSGGNGALLTADSTGGAASDRIVLNGTLIVDNTPGAQDGVGPITLSNISGGGGLFQEGTQTVTLLENTAYTGATEIANGTLALGKPPAGQNAASIAASRGVALLNAAAIFDISGAGDQTIRDLSGSAGGIVALGANTLTLGTGGDTSFSGSIDDGGLSGGTGGGLTKAGTGTLTLSGRSLYTGATAIESGTLVLAGASLASTGVSVARGASLEGSGLVAGAVSDSGVVIAASGTLTLAGLLTGAGALQVADGATLVLGGADTADASFLGTGALRLDGGGHALVTIQDTAKAFGGSFDAVVTIAQGADTVVAAGGADAVIASASGQTILGSSSPGGATVVVLAGASTGDSIVGGADSIGVFDSVGGNQVLGGAGTTYFVGGPGIASTVTGSGGEVAVFGSAGDSLVLAGTGDKAGHTISGFVAGRGNETLNGGAYGGTLFFFAANQADTVAAGGESLTGGTGINGFLTGDGNETIAAGAGANVFFLANAAGGASSTGSILIANFGATTNNFVEAVGFSDPGELARDVAAGTAGGTPSDPTFTIHLSDGMTVTFLGVDTLAGHLI